MTDLLPGAGQAAVFATAVFVLNATPGVDFLLTVSRTLQGGARAGVAAVLGITAGCAVHALAAAFGLAALLALHPQAFALIQWAGAAYLVWLGVGMLRQAWRPGAAPTVAGQGVARRRWMADFRAGMLTNVLNPKVALFFLAFLPQFVPAGSPSKTVSFLLLGAWFVMQGLAFSLALVAATARLSRLQASPTARRVLNAVGGGLFIALALRLLGRPGGAGMKRVLVVGASRGIGLELVRQYREAGDAVTATARSDEGMARLQALGATPLWLDLTTDATATALAGALGGQAFDVVLLCAGVFGPRSSGLQAPTQAEFDEVMHTNLLGAMRVLPQVVDALAPGDPLPRVAVISSRMGSMGLRASPAGWLYRASKAALNSVLVDASLVLAGKAICVALHPGWVRTDMGGAGADIDVQTSAADLRRTLAALTPADNGGFFNHDGQPLAW